jgi:hypothetical protein
MLLFRGEESATLIVDDVFGVSSILAAPGAEKTSERFRPDLMLGLEGGVSS